MSLPLCVCFQFFLLFFFKTEFFTHTKKNETLNKNAWKKAQKSSIFHLLSDAYGSYHRMKTITSRIVFGLDINTVCALSLINLVIAMRSLKNIRRINFLLMKVYLSGYRFLIVSTLSGCLSVYSNFDDNLYNFRLIKIWACSTAPMFFIRNGLNTGFHSLL